MKNQIYTLVKELFLTFSNKKSFLSSKRIERFIAFATTVSLIITFLYYNHTRLTATDFTITLSPLFMYMGFNSVLIKKEKTLENGEEK